MCIHCNARGRHESPCRAHSASWRSIYTRSELSFWKRSFYFSARKKLKGSSVVVSVATAKVEGRRRSWTGGEGCPLDPFDATDEPSGCSPSQAAIRTTMIVFNHQLGKFSHSCCVNSQTSVTRQASRQRKEPLPQWRRSTWTRAKCGRRPLWSRYAWLSWTAFPTKNSLSIISYEKASQVFEEEELDKHRLLAQWGVVRLVPVVVVRGVESTTGSAWMMGVQVHTGIHWDAHQTFFCTKGRGRGGVQANSSGIRI